MFTLDGATGAPIVGVMGRDTHEFFHPHHVTLHTAEDRAV